MQTLLCDLNSITNDGNYVWTQEEKYALESQLVLHTSQPLCLDPRPVVSLVKHKLQAHKHKLNNRQLKRAMRRYSCLNTIKQQHRIQRFHLPFPFHIVKIRKKYANSNYHQQQEDKSSCTMSHLLIDKKMSPNLNGKIHLKSSNQRILQVLIFCLIFIPFISQ